jgi:uncharacterized protein
MVMTVSSAEDMIRGMNPVLQPGTFVFAAVADSGTAEAIAQQALASFREDEGLSVLLPEDKAKALGLNASPPMRQITLKVYSSLTGVGLTAAVATALAAANIPCNMIAATLHDHVFVPADQADAAMHVLRRLQQEAAGSGNMHV